MSDGSTTLLCWRCDPPALVAALTDPVLLVRYQESLAAEHEISAEADMAAHQRRMHALAGRALVDGFDALARRDALAADTLLTDLLAVATWRGWELPLDSVPPPAVPPTELPSGLLGTGAAAEGACAWLLDGASVALCRGRAARAEVRRDDQHRS